MGRYTSEALTAAFRGLGLNATALPPPDETILKIGRANTSCKECLPLILTTGSLLHYISGRSRGEVVVYFMPTSLGLPFRTVFCFHGRSRYAP